MPMPTKLTDRRKKAFLLELSRHGILVRAARAASPRASSRYGAKLTANTCLLAKALFLGHTHQQIAGARVVLEAHHGLRHGAGAQGQGDGTQGGANKCRGRKFHVVSNVVL